MVSNGKSATSEGELSPLARALLHEMASNPNRLEYNTRVLGGEFDDDGILRLDGAYKELLDRQLVVSGNAIVSFFGQPKIVYKITEKGKAEAQEEAA